MSGSIDFAKDSRSVRRVRYAGRLKEFVNNDLLATAVLAINRVLKVNEHPLLRKEDFLSWDTDPEGKYDLLPPDNEIGDNNGEDR